MKHNLPYLINLPPFLLKDLDTKNLRGLSLLIFCSIFLKLPAAAFLGFENLFFSSNFEFKAKKSFFSKKISPLISIFFG